MQAAVPRRQAHRHHRAFCARSLYQLPGLHVAAPSARGVRLEKAIPQVDVNKGRRRSGGCPGAGFARLARYDRHAI